MTRRIFLTAAACLGLAAHAAAKPAPTPTFPVADIKPGMRGVTMTVLQGTNIVPVETEIRGVAENYLGPGKHLIIGRLVDEKTKVTGAVHGMSGSPLYLDGKMAGALSRRLMLFEKDAHCGFTPIHDMFEVREHQSRALHAQTAAATPVWSPFAMLQPNAPAPGATRAALDAGGRLAVPLSLPATSRRGLDLLEKIWAGSGFLAAPGGGSASGPDSVPGWKKPGGDLQPGAAVAAALATGDLAMAGTGTLTWREGDRILAFGHPMLGMGPVDLPMCEAEIITTIPSYLMPYKLANVRRVAGTVTEDRLSAIAGVIGRAPATPPYRITLRHQGREPRVFEGGFVNNENLTAPIVASLMIPAILDNDESGEDFTIRAAGALKLKGLPALELNDTRSGGFGTVIGLLFDTMDRVEKVYRQPFAKVQAESFDLALDVAPERREWTVEEIRLNPRRPSPGGVLHAEVILRPRHGNLESRQFTFRLPDGAASGEEFEIEAASAAEFARRDAGADPEPDESFGGGFMIRISFNSGPSVKPESLEEIIAQLNRRRPRDEIAVRITETRPGLRLARARLENLPPSVESVIAASATPSEKLSRATLDEKSASMPGVVRGAARARLVID